MAHAVQRGAASHFTSGAVDMSKKKLTLNLKTVRTLTQGQLAAVAGGKGASIVCSKH